MISLLEFARNGLLGELRIGATRQEVNAYLQTPDSWYGFNAKTMWQAYFWSYGDLKIYFDTESSQVIALETVDDLLAFEDLGGLKKEIDPWLFNARLELSQFKSALKTEAIEFDEVQGGIPCYSDLFTNQGDVGFRFVQNSERSVEFANSDQEAFTLYKFWTPANWGAAKNGDT